MRGYESPKAKFAFNGGKGEVKIQPIGSYDITYAKFNESITVTKATICAKNLIWGGLYIDAEGTVEGVNHKTGERAEVVFHLGDSKNLSSVVGKCYDAQGVCRYEIEGSWL